MPGHKTLMLNYTQKQSYCGNSFFFFISFLFGGVLFWRCERLDERTAWARGLCGRHDLT